MKMCIYLLLFERLRSRAQEKGRRCRGRKIPTGWLTPRLSQSELYEKCKGWDLNVRCGVPSRCFTHFRHSMCPFTSLYMFKDRPASILLRCVSLHPQLTGKMAVIATCLLSTSDEGISHWTRHMNCRDV